MHILKDLICCDEPMAIPVKADLSSNWQLDESIIFLNHGSFGATPTLILEEQRRWQNLMETEPVRFFEEIAPKALLESRKAVSKLLNCDYDDLVLIENATSGVNTILRSLEFNPSDEIIVTNHTYQACRNSLDFIAKKYSAVVVVCEIPFPVKSSKIIIENVLSCVTKNTKLAMIDTVTSPTGLKLPFEKIVKNLESLGIKVLLDAAHGIGMFPIDLNEIGASFTITNCHKWLCSPKGTAIMHVRRDLQELIHPLTISHGMTFPLGETTRFRHEFDWTGTRDVSAWCVLPFLINFLDNLIDGGLNEIMLRNNKLVLKGRDIICDKLNIEKPCPDDMISCIATIKLPGTAVNGIPLHEPDPLHLSLLEKYKIQVPVWYWPNPEGRYLRISSYLYNHESEYEYLADALLELLNKV